MSNFEERSGIVKVETPWGFWFQTISEVFVEVDVDFCLKSENENSASDSSKPITGKEIKCTITNKKVKLVVRGRTIFEGEFPQPIHGDDSIWTLEDKKTIRICLPKTQATSGNVWPSLLKDSYFADTLTFDQMKRKQTLEQFQIDNPGMDFSHSTISGDYDKGGLQLPP